MKVEPQLRAKLLRWCLFLLVALGVVAVRVVVESRSELERADALRAEASLEEAIVHYRRAARWYAPGNPYSRLALVRLAELAQDAEEAESFSLALSAHRAIRAGILSTRSFYTPHQSLLDAANRRIAALMMTQPRAPMDLGRSAESLEAEYLGQLQQELRPSPGWVALLLVAFVAWLVALYLLLVKGLDGEGRWVAGVARRWAACALVSWLLWVLALAMA